MTFVDSERYREGDEGTRMSHISAHGKVVHYPSELFCRLTEDDLDLFLSIMITQIKSGRLGPCVIDFQVSSSKLSL